MSQPPGYPHYQDSPAHQAASRKMKRKHQGGGSQQQQQQRQHPSHLRGGPGGGSSGAGRQAFLVPPGSTGPMAWGHAYEDEGTDMIMDEMDRLTPRDLAVARFRRNHDFIEAIFDEKKIANLQPPPSPYADLSKKDLQAQLDLSEAQTAEMKRLHEERIQSFKQNLSPEYIERDVARQAEVKAEEEAALEPWARNAGKGRRLTAGFAYVQARTPDVVKGALRARETALSEQRAEATAGQESAEARQRKAAEDEAIRKLNLEHGMEPPAPVHMPPPPQQQQQPRPAPQQQQQQQQQQQPLASEQPQQQEPRKQEEQQLPRTNEAQPANVGSEAAEADADEDADADPDADADADADGEGDGDGDGDQEMVELVDNGEGGAAGLAAVPEAAPEEQPQQTQEEEVADAATANEEAENLTHPLSAEAEVAASAPEGTTAVTPAETALEVPAASEAAPEVIQDAASEAPLQATAPAEPEVGTEAATAAPTEAAPTADITPTVVPPPSEDSAGVPPVAEEVSQQQPSEQVMKAPTPPLDENLAENDAPKEL